MTGEIAAVEAAIDAAKHKSSESGMYLDSCVIANPDRVLAKFLV
jgi:microcompartment protein CcmL/EutN